MENLLTFKNNERHFNNIKFATCLKILLHSLNKKKESSKIKKNYNVKEPEEIKVHITLQGCLNIFYYFR